MLKQKVKNWLKAKQTLFFALFLMVSYGVIYFVGYPQILQALTHIIYGQPKVYHVIERVKATESEIVYDDKIMAERIIEICKENSLTKNEDIKWVLGKLWNESNWQQYKNHINVHKDGKTSLDRGIAMWNDYFHPEVSDECAYNLECAIGKMIEYRKDGKDIWVASDRL